MVKLGRGNITPSVDSETVEVLTHVVSNGSVALDENPEFLHTSAFDSEETEPLSL